MKNHTFLTALLFISVLEIAALFLFAFQDANNIQDPVLVNEAVQSVQADWDSLKSHKNQTTLDYTVLDMDGTVLIQTKPGLSESINHAVIHRDTILDIQNNGSVVGKILIHNDSSQSFQSAKLNICIFLSAAILLQCSVCVIYSIHLNRTIIKPFEKLKGFAERIAEGNLEIPLEMDRQNLFGAFTESFDIMRSELKKARMAEAQANASKNELVARLSHDIKTPVASIKAASEVGAALAESEKTKNNYLQIILKADQIDTLITNLFSAALEELQQLSAVPEDLESTELETILENSNYLHLAKIPDIPDCILYTDKLRLQQVFDNLFTNSHKYAGSEIDISISQDSRFLIVSIEDYGGGVNQEDLPHLKERFWRGSNTKSVEGAGLGLYISDYFMKEMLGELMMENGENGLKATVKIPLSGTI